MSACRNVLLIVVDQWRGLMLPKLGADYLKLPNIDRLCAEGVTFRNHFTQCVPCGPARASLLTSQYLMNHRAVQNTIPLDNRFTNLAHELRRGGYDPALVGYTTTTPDPRTTAPNDPRFFVLGDIMEGFHSVGAFENRDAYFGWVASQGFKLPEIREDIWLPEGAPGAGATARPARIPKELSDTAWFTERGLDLPARPHRQAVVHPPRLLSPAPAFHRLGALPRDVPAGGHAEAGARRLAGGGSPAECAARLLCEQQQAVELLPGRPGPRLGDERAGRGADARHLLRPDERDRRPARPRLRLSQADRPVGRHADRLHLRSWRAGGRPSPAGQDRLFRRILSHSDDRARSAAAPTTPLCLLARRDGDGCFRSPSSSPARAPSRRAASARAWTSPAPWD